MSFSNFVLAYSECVLDVGSVYIETIDGGSDLIWIQLIKSNGGAIAIKKTTANNLSTVQQNRLYTLGLTAFTAGKRLKVRYPEDGLDCTTLSGGRDDFIGVRLIH